MTQSRNPLPSALPCPFCGSLRITVEWEPCEPLDRTDTNRRWFAECMDCSFQGPFCQKENRVIPMWNCRVPADIEDLGDGLVAIIGHLSELIEEIRQVATGERQVGYDDTERIEWIAKRIAAVRARNDQAH